MKTGEIAIIAILAGVAGLVWASSQIKPPKITAPPITKPPAEPDGDDSGIAQWIKWGEDLIGAIFGGGSSTVGCWDGSTASRLEDCPCYGLTGTALQQCQNQQGAVD